MWTTFPGALKWYNLDSLFHADDIYVAHCLRYADDADSRYECLLHIDQVICTDQNIYHFGIVKFQTPMVKVAICWLNSITKMYKIIWTDYKLISNVLPLDYDYDTNKNKKYPIIRQKITGCSLFSCLYSLASQLYMSKRKI